MAYEVTATRRRPKNFEDLIGQEFVAATLKNSIKTGKIAHAYLFTGPRGCGKTSTARILAKALNCENGPTDTPCCTCSTCQEITKGSSLDVIEIDGASNTGINDARQVIEEVKFPPNSSRYKIYIIDEVHMISNQAFNALLKTIEEPPPYAIFIFATTELQKVPATIKSRCQQFNFRLVPIEKVKEQLAEACKDIGITAEDEALYWIARESTGSMRDAYTLFDQVAAFSDGHITYEKIRDKLGLVGTERLNDLFDDCVDSNAAGVTEKLDQFLQSGISIEQLITNSADYLRSLLLIKSGITKESLLGQAADRYSKKVLGAWNSVQLERGLSLFLNLYRDIRYSLSPRYEIELIFSKLCWLKEYVSPAEIKKAIDSAQSLLMQGAASVPQSPVSGGTSMPGFSGTAQTVSSQSQTASQVNAQPVATSFSQSQANAAPASGIPMFSALQNSGQEFTPPPQQEENPDPFYNGGALPPDNTEAADDYSQPVPPDEIPPSFAYEDTVQPMQSSPSQGSQNLAGISLENIKAKLVATTSIDDAFISASLMHTEDWSLNGNVIEAKIESEFELNQLMARAAIISQMISNIVGEKVSFNLTLKQVVKIERKVEIPEIVNIIARTFKGTIVGGQ